MFSETYINILALPRRMSSPIPAFMSCGVRVTKFYPDLDTGTDYPELERLVEKLRKNVALRQLPTAEGADYNKPVRAGLFDRGHGQGLEVTPAEGCYLKVLPEDDGGKVRFERLEYGRLDLRIGDDKYAIETREADDMLTKIHSAYGLLCPSRNT